MERGNIRLVVALLAQILSLSVVHGARWRTIDAAGVHAAREETTFSPCGGTNLCLLGGRGRAPTPVLDTKTLKWSNGPAPPIELHHFQGVVGPDGCAWILGAWTGAFPGEVAAPDIYRYCADTAKWEVVGKMGRARGAGAAVFYEGNFYVATGNVGGHKVSAKTVNWFDKYDPVKKVWTKMPNVPHPRDHVGAAVVGNKLYLVGGRDSGGADYPHFFDLVEPKVDVFDFSSGTWSTMTNDFPAPRAGASVVVYKGALWVAGGEGSGKAWDEVEILSGNRPGSRFTDGPKMPHPRHGFGMVSCNGVLWVAGGAGTEGGGASQTMLDAYHAGEKPKACRFSVTGTSKPSTSPIPPSPAPSPSSPSEAIPTPSNSPISIPATEPIPIPVAEPTAAPQNTKTPVTSEVLSEPSEPTEPITPPARQPTPVSEVDTDRDTDTVVEDELTATASTGTSTHTSKKSEENHQHPPSSTSILDSISASYDIEPSPESTTAPHTGGEVDTSVSDEESVDESHDKPHIAGINGMFNDHSGIDSESDEIMSGVDMEPKEKNDDGGGNDSSSSDDNDDNSESDGDFNNENSNTFLSPSVIPTPEISMPVLNFSLDDLPTLISLHNKPMDGIDISLTPEPGLEGVPVEVDADGSSSSEKACFPGHATVRLYDGTIKNMDTLQTGDRVLVAHPDQYSEVFFFSHKHPHHVSNFVSLRTDTEFAIHVSARHLVYANGELTEAQHVHVGDVLSIAHQTETATVTSVNRIAAKGLYNPHTLHGDIVVDNIAASTLTRSLHPRVAKAFLIPFNAVYRALGPHEYVDTLNRQVLQALDYFVW